MTSFMFIHNVFLFFAVFCPLCSFTELVLACLFSLNALCDFWKYFKYTMSPATIALTPNQHRLVGLRNTSKAFLSPVLPMEHFFFHCEVLHQSCLLFYLKVSRPLHVKKNRTARRFPHQLSRLLCRDKVFWVSALLGHQQQALNSLQAVCRGTALLSVAHPLQAVQVHSFHQQCPLERYVSNFKWLSPQIRYFYTWI